MSHFILRHFSPLNRVNHEAIIKAKILIFVFDFYKNTEKKKKEKTEFTIKIAGIIVINIFIKKYFPAASIICCAMLLH